jgi:hypothetical protein
MRISEFYRVSLSRVPAKDMLGWVTDLARARICYEEPDLEEALEKFISREQLGDYELETVKRWAECMYSEVSQPPLPEVFGALIAGLEEMLREREERWELLERYKALVEEHRRDSCSQYTWLARRTYRFMDSPAITKKQFERLYGKPPSPAIIDERGLVPWSWALDELAEDLGRRKFGRPMDTNELAECILAAYDREQEIFRLLEELKKEERR